MFTVSVSDAKGQFMGVSIENEEIATKLVSNITEATMLDRIEARARATGYTETPQTQ